jgi:hypothetical protein
MAARNTKKADAAEVGKPIEKLIKRGYLYWGIGIMIAALGLKPSSINAGGLSLTIEHPKVIQGVLYLAALEKAVSALLYFQRAMNPFSKRVALRGFLWSGLPRGTRSFRHADLPKVRRQARLALKFISSIHVALAVILLLLIIPFKIKAVWAALVAIFSSSF